jgi:protein MpaA
MHRRPRHAAVAGIAAAFAVTFALGGCADEARTSAASAPADGTTATPVASTVAPTITPSPLATTTTTLPAPTTTTLPATTTTTTTTTTTPSTTTTLPAVVETRQLGTSVQGQPITAIRRGTPGGTVVLIIGVIHGNEAAGHAIADDLQTLAVPADVDLWIVPSMNPDGELANVRHNANGVDLNRNFPYNWGPIGVVGDSQYAGPSAASEPETQEMVSFMSEIQPDLTIWYHQDLYRISPGEGAEAVIRARYAALTGLPVIDITGGIYTGVAATWARRTLPGYAFIVELGESLADGEAATHAAAVLTVASELE